MLARPRSANANPFLYHPTAEEVFTQGFSEEYVVGSQNCQFFCMRLCQAICPPEDVKPIKASLKKKTFERPVLFMFSSLFAMVISLAIYTKTNKSPASKRGKTAEQKEQANGLAKEKKEFQLNLRPTPNRKSLWRSKDVRSKGRRIANIEFFRE